MPCQYQDDHYHPPKLRLAPRFGSQELARTVVTMTISPDAYDAPLSALRNHVEDIATWLAIWSAGQESDPHARRCTNDAIDAIDGAIRELHQVRSRLIGEIRDADDATAASADAPLRRGRECG